MAQTTICPECGSPIMENATTCQECGFPLANNQKLNPDPNMGSYVVADEGDNNAERIMRNYLNWIRTLIIIFSVLFGIIGVIGGFVALSNNSGVGILGILGGIIALIFGIALAWLVWSAGMILINISTNVRTIKNILKSR